MFPLTISISVPVLYCCHNKSPKTEWLNTTCIYYFMYLPVRNLTHIHEAKIKVSVELPSLPEAIGEDPFPAYSRCWQNSVSCDIGLSSGSTISITFAKSFFLLNITHSQILEFRVWIFFFFFFLFAGGGQYSAYHNIIVEEMSSTIWWKKERVTLKELERKN